MLTHSYADLRNVDERELLQRIRNQGAKLGIIAGNGSFPFLVATETMQHGIKPIIVAHKGETDNDIIKHTEALEWIKVGELGKLVSFFVQHQVRYVVLAGGISRIKAFGGVKLDLRGMALIARIRSFKDDLIMRGVAEELAKEQITVLPCTLFLRQALVEETVLTKRAPSNAELADIELGKETLAAISKQHVGQCVVMKDGVVVAIEAVEGTDAAIKRGMELGGKGCVVVKFAKPDQDMRFDVPTVGPKTIEAMQQGGATVLALEAGRCIILEKEKTIQLANKKGISIVGSPSLV